MKESKMIIAPYGATKKIVKIPTVIYFEAITNGSNVHTDSDIIVTDYTLKYWYQIVDKNSFIFANRSVLLCMRRIKSISENCVQMDNGAEIIVSRRRKQQFLDDLYQFASTQR